jgi:Reverse transcriptase (RNA-dependent DNA polymerase)
VIRSSVVTFDELEKGGTVDLRFRGTRNTLPDREPRGRPRNKMPESVEQKTVPKPPGQSEDQDTNRIESRPTISVEVPKKSVTWNDPEVVVVESNEDIDKLNLEQSNTESAPKPQHGASDLSLKPLCTPIEEAQLQDPSPVQKTGKRDRDDDSDEEYHLRNRKVARAFAVHGQKIPIPGTWKEAVNDPVFAADWEDAIDRELTALRANGTWEQVVPPSDANLVSSKWVFDVKYAENGGVDRFKARLVARGFSQRQGIDYEDTFAPTMRMDSLRVLLAIVAIEDLECHQVDVNNAFTESKMNETIYMTPPEGVKIPRGTALRVLKSLYGLKQAARDWYNCLSEALLKMGFQPTPADPCIFRNEYGVLVGIWVDDLVIAARLLSQIDGFKTNLAQYFKIKDLGETRRILGMRVVRDRPQKALYLDQEIYINKIMSELRMEEDSHKPVKSPINGYDALTRSSEDEERTDTRRYQRYIGSIMYAMINTRPDTAFTTAKLAQFMSDPATRHEAAAKHLLRYIRSTKDTRIRYGPEDPNLVGYSDADYASDKADRKSIIGNVFMLAGGAVSWLSRKQRSVATSTTEAEYISMSTCAKQAIWLAQLLRDIGYAKYLGASQWTTNLRGDNQSSLALIRNPHIHDRSKHIDIAYHHIRDLEKHRRINIEYVGTDEMIADGLTKPLTGPALESHIRLLGLCRTSASL